MITQAGVQYLKDILLLRATLIKVKYETPPSPSTSKIIKGFEKSITVISTIKISQESENHRLITTIQNSEGLIIAKFTNNEEAYIFIAQNALIFP